MTDEFSISEDTIVTTSKTARTLRRADVMFLLDCTGTMENTLNVVTSTIDEVVETYADSKVQIRLGLVEFRDLTQPPRDEFEALKMHTFERESNFTSDVKLYQTALTGLTAAGGGPLPESTWDAMALASLKADWDEKADKVMVLFSDAIPYRTGKIIDDVCALCELLKAKKIDQLHFVIDREDDKKIQRFTDVLRCIPDVRDPRNTIFGNTYSIASKSKGDHGHLDHLKRVLLNIAKTSGDHAGGNTSGSNPYASADSTRQQHIKGCALERRSGQPPKKNSRLKDSNSDDDQNLDRGNEKGSVPRPRNKKNPYS